MPKPYSLDLRERVVASLEKKVPQKQTAEMFSISVESVKRWWKRYKEEKTIKPKIPITTKPRMVSYDKIRKYVEDNPDSTQKEIGNHFGLKDKASFYILKKIGFTYKKRGFYTLNEMKD